MTVVSRPDGKHGPHRGAFHGPRGVLAAIDRALVAPGPARTFRQVRTGLALVIALRLLVGQWRSLASLPADLFQPAFAVRWVPGMPPATVLVGIQVTGLLAAGVAAFGGRGARQAFAVAWLSLLVLGGLWSSTGKVMHNEILLLLAALPFVAAPGSRAEDGEGDGDPSTEWGWPPRAALVIIAIAYAASGLQKLYHSGLDWVMSDNLRWVMHAAVRSDPPVPQLAQAVVDRPMVAHLAAAGALAIEVVGPLLLVRRRTRIVFVALAASLHIGIWLAHGLDYSAWVLTVAVVALPMAATVRREAPVSGTPAAVGDTVGS
ncbi:MAG: hypothetical protein JWM47_1216 [Acidimicrobiales bacterium]|nr:hypothetical protein [Acidimicrobiales bacterium]